MTSLISPALDAEGDPDFEYDAQGGIYTSQYCEHAFSTKRSLAHHTNTHTIRNDQTLTLKCRYCAKPFGSQVGKRRHEKRHEHGSKDLKMPGLLAGSPFSTSGCNFSPISYSVASPCPTNKNSQNSPLYPNSDVLSKDAGVGPDQSLVLEENKGSKELYTCKYCNKAFGTHTNMRRHQRRIHERHLMSKGVRKKEIISQDILSQQIQPGQCSGLREASPHKSPQLIYVPNIDTDDEDELEDSMVNVSKNISENLSLYIDGKIVSTSTVSNCEVIEVDSSSPLFGLDAVILNSTQISQTFQFQTLPCHENELLDIDQSVSKRRTSTPPLLPNVKPEPDTMSNAASSSAFSQFSFLSSLESNKTLQPTETLTFQKEKPIYLSPKLKQLLQTHDSQKQTIAFNTDRHKLTTPLSVTSLSAARGRFKRRTASPPPDVQKSLLATVDSSIVEIGDSFSVVVPKVESNCAFSLGVSSQKQRDCTSPSEKDWPVIVGGGSSCNQQPLDLSGVVGKQDCSMRKEPDESVLDLTIHHKNVNDHKTKSSLFFQSHVKRKKPNTSILEKVLMNEYSGLSSAGEEVSSFLRSPETYLLSGGTSGMSPTSACSNLEHPPSESVSPPLLTPVTVNPSSPSSSSQASSTPPPPVLPSVPSSSPLSQFLDSAFSKLSPKPAYHIVDEMSKKKLSPRADLQSQISEDKIVYCNADFFSTSDTLLENSNFKSGLTNINNVIPLHEKNTDFQSIQSGSFTRLAHPDHSVATDLFKKQPFHSSVPLASNMNLFSTSGSAGEFNIKLSANDAQCSNKEMIEDAIESTTNDKCDFLSRGSDKIPGEAETLEQDIFTNDFVCNVCEEPFYSIKLLSKHIIDHSADWPFKCEFCVQLFQNAAALLKHRSSLHGVQNIFCCPICAKEFAFLCNLHQHQSDLHPGQSHAHSMAENGKLRPQNYTDPTQLNVEIKTLYSTTNITEDGASQDPCELLNCSSIKEEGDGDPTEELYTTIKIMASEAGKPKCPDVRFGINQHYPSFKPPPFPYHSRTPAVSVASATNFTTHNIPQTFSTAIRCTKCGISFDNMPGLHKHILLCANASDKRRYTPKRNPIPLRQIVTQPQNGVFLPIVPTNRNQNAFYSIGQTERLNFTQKVPTRIKRSALKKKKNQLVHKAICQKNKPAISVKKVYTQEEEQDVQACPYCSREFTYAASLAKHIACSCPQKPVSKKKNMATMPKDKNTKLRSQSTVSEIRQEGNSTLPVKPLGKTRSQSLELVESEVTSGCNGKADTVQICVKRPALNKDYSDPKNKKSRNGKPETSVMTSPLTHASQPSAKMQIFGKTMTPKKEAVTKHKKECFLKSMRKRIGGPVTRSLQIASATPSQEVKAKNQPISEPVSEEHNIHKKSLGQVR